MDLDQIIVEADSVVNEQHSLGGRTGEAVYFLEIRGDHTVFRLLPLEHTPLNLYSIAGLDLIVQGVEVAHVEAALKDSIENAFLQSVLAENNYRLLQPHQFLAELRQRARQTFCQRDGWPPTQRRQPAYI
jgi:hypothetical protein